MHKTSDVPPHHQLNRSLTSHIKGSQYSILRNSADDPDPDKVLNIPCADAFSVIVQLRDFASHRLWQGGRLAYKGGHARESLSIAYLGDEVRCQHLAPYDNLRLNLPRASLEGVLYEEGVSTPASFDCGHGMHDPVAYHLSQALIPTLSMPGEVNKLFVDQVMLAMCTHISSRYGNAGPLPGTTKGLAPWQVRRAKELIANHLADGLSVARLAEECALSRSYFTRALKQSTGMSPHDWLLQMRVEKAKELMLRTRLT